MTDLYKTLPNTYRTMKLDEPLTEYITNEPLNEVRLIRGGSVLVLAAKAREYGNKVSQSSKRGKDELNKIQKAENIEKKLDALSGSLTHMFDAIMYSRLQIGSLTGIALTTGLISERSNKELSKLMGKGNTNRRRR